jgi:hypothetical protein
LGDGTQYKREGVWNSSRGLFRALFAPSGGSPVLSNLSESFFTEALGAGLTALETAFAAKSDGGRVFALILWRFFGLAGR